MLLGEGLERQRGPNQGLQFREILFQGLCGPVIAIYPFPQLLQRLALHLDLLLDLLVLGKDFVLVPDFLLAGRTDQRRDDLRFE